MQCHPWSHPVLLEDGATPPTRCPSSWCLGAELELMGQAMERGCRNVKAQDCASSTYLHCRISPCAFTAPFRSCKYHLCLLQKGHRSGVILFQCLSDLPWTELIPDRNGHFKKPIFRNLCMLCSSQHWSRKALETHWRRKEWCSKRRKPDNVTRKKDLF